MSTGTPPQSPSPPVWGVPAIAKEIGRTERATYHMLEKGCVVGAVKIGGRWAFDPVAFRAQFVAP